jgi:hypothetical protein
MAAPTQDFIRQNWPYDVRQLELLLRGNNYASNSDIGGLGIDGCRLE